MSQWKIRNDIVIDDEQIKKNAAQMGIDTITAEILYRRGLTSTEAMTAFLKPRLEDLHDPFLLRDMNKAVARIVDAIQQQEKICVYGDYDADGTVGTAVLCRYLDAAGGRVRYHISNRHLEGYGLHKGVITQLKEDGVRLIITVDNGIAAEEEIAYAKSLGIDTIVTDHHECPGMLPDAVAVVDAKREDNTYPFRELCGAGVAFKLIQALLTVRPAEVDLHDMLECVALATIADMVPIVEENRIMVYHGLKSINEGPKNPGIAAMMQVNRLEHLNAGQVSFILGPQLNAPGRLDVGDCVVALLWSDGAEGTETIARKLKDFNDERQRIERNITRQAVTAIRQAEDEKNDIVLAYHPEWHTGVIGIVASKIQEIWYKPTIVIGLDDKGVAKGSCRSVVGTSIYEYLKETAEHLINYGGHNQAAGFSIEPENISTFYKALLQRAEEKNQKQYNIKTISYDVAISPEEMSLDNVKNIERFEPYGLGNPKPLVCIENEVVDNVRWLGQEQNHLSFQLGREKAIAFRAKGRFPVSNHHVVSVVAQPTVNRFRGMENLQWVIQDLKINSETAHEQARSVLNKVASGAPLNPVELQRLQSVDIDRGACVEIYQWLRKNQSPYVLHSHTDFIKLLFVLEILVELDLISYTIEDESLSFEIHQTRDKKDIQQAPLMIKLKTYSR